MAVSGPKLKAHPRHRNPARVEWTDVPNVPFDSAPKLPPTPAPPKRLEAPEPARLLGHAGGELWHRIWASSTIAPDVDLVLQVCEQTDERVALRVRVLRDNDWRERKALRLLDDQITDNLVRLANAQDHRRPRTWPAATRRWWHAVSRLPHCVLWTEAEWQFAMDTASLVAAFHAGEFRLAMEIRTREKMMGTTRDARRDLRIRYVDIVEPDNERDPQVTAMADYRRSVSAT